MIAGISPTAESMRRFVSRVTPGNPVLIGGEHGVGKKLLAKKIIEAYYKGSSNPSGKIFCADHFEPEMLGDSILITTDRAKFDALSVKIKKNIWIAPLRDRLEDIPVFVDHFSSNCPDRENWYASDKMNRLLSYWWPLNVAELKNVICSETGAEMLPYSRLKTILAHFPATKIVSTKMESFWDDLGKNVNPGKFFHLFLESVEKEFIKSALKRCKGSINETAELLDIHRNTLNQKIKKLGIKK